MRFSSFKSWGSAEASTMSDYGVRTNSTFDAEKSRLVAYPFHALNDTFSRLQCCIMYEVYTWDLERCSKHRVKWFLGGVGVKINTKVLKT